MTDREDQLVTAMFADLRREVAGHLRPAGAAAAAATLRRRRRSRAVAGAALAVALVVGPAFGLAWAGNRADTAPEIGTPPSVGASASSAPPSDAAPSQSAPPSVVDPGIPAEVLQNMTLPVPRWPGSHDSACASGRVRFTAGKAATPGNSVTLTLAGDPVHVDLDGDGRLETVIRVDCALQGIFTQVVAFSRAADGTVTTFGRVVATHVDGSDVQKVWRIEAGGSGTVRVDVGDVSPCCGIPADLPQHQWRSYGWDGRAFVQTGGPTAFPTNPKTTDLALSAPNPLGTAATDAGTWVGGLAVTVTNKGPHKADRLEVTLTFAVEVTLTGPDAGGCGSAAIRSTSHTCRFAHLAAGVSRTLRWDVTAHADPRGTTTTVSVGHGSTNGETYPDIRQPDNVVNVAGT